MFGTPTYSAHVFFLLYHQNVLVFHSSPLLLDKRIPLIQFLRIKSCKKPLQKRFLIHHVFPKCMAALLFVRHGDTNENLNNSDEVGMTLLDCFFSSREKEFSHVKNYLGSWVRISDQDKMAYPHQFDTQQQILKNPSRTPQTTWRTPCSTSLSISVPTPMLFGEKRRFPGELPDEVHSLTAPSASRFQSHNHEPTSHHPLRSSGYLFSLSTRACNKIAPSSSAALG